MTPPEVVVVKFTRMSGHIEYGWQPATGEYLRCGRCKRDLLKMGRANQWRHQAACDRKAWAKGQP